MKQVTILLNGKKYTIEDSPSLLVQIVGDNVYINGDVCFPDTEISVKPQPPLTIKYWYAPKQIDARVFWLICTLTILSLLMVVGGVIMRMNSL